MANTQLRTLNEGSESYPHFFENNCQKTCICQKDFVILSQI